MFVQTDVSLLKKQLSFSGSRKFCKAQNLSLLILITFHIFLQLFFGNETTATFKV